MPDNLFFTSSKILTLLFSPDNLIVLLAVLGWLALVLGRLGLARRLLSVVTLALLVLGFLPLGSWLLTPLENRFPANLALPAEASGIIVLGGAIDPVLSESWQQTELDNAAERIVAAAYLAGIYPGAQLLYTGGSGQLGQNQWREADYAPFLFRQLGLETSAMLFESESRNTWQNAVNSQALLGSAEAPDSGNMTGLASGPVSGNWILVTSAYHMPRAVGVFCRRNWPVYPYPVDHRSTRNVNWGVRFALAENLQRLKTALREWAGLVAYRLSGRSSQLLPGYTNHCGAPGDPGAKENQAGASQEDGQGLAADD